MKNIVRLLVADPHFTDKPADEYRWGLFKWIAKQVDRYGIDQVDFLGDLTDSKEGHKAAFVNRLAGEIAQLSEKVPCTFLEGNHDYKLTQQPFFKFLGLLPNVRWVSDIEDFDDALYLPHTKTPEEDWQDIIHMFPRFNYVFMHQCFMGAKSSLGFELEGASPLFGKLKNTKIYAGDIHVPQQVGQVEYVGSPYPVHYGDRFLGRCIITDSFHRRKVIHYPTIEKFTAVIESPGELRELGILEQDQIKVRYKLASGDRDRWPEIKEAIKSVCADIGAHLGGIELLSNDKDLARIATARKQLNSLSPIEAVEAYCRREGLSDSYLDSAKEFL